LRSFYLYLSDSCNLACRHCWITPHFVDGKPDPGQVIDKDTLQKAVEEAKPMGLSHAKLTGGEPLLHPNFVEIASMLTRAGLSLDMETNGILITAEMARFFKQKTKISFISISIDGADAETHDWFRGVEGAYHKALRGLDYLVQAGYKNAQVIMAVHQKNVDQVEDVVRLAAAHGAASVKLNPVTNSGRGQFMQQRGELLDYRQHIDLAHYMYDELRPALHREGLTIDLIYNIPLALMPVGELVRRNGNTGDCGVLGILGVLGSGEIVLCGIGRTIPELVYGRLGRDSIYDIWLNHSTIQKLRRLLPDMSCYPEICRDCVMVKRCRTGCVAQNYVDSGELLWPHFLCREAVRLGEFPQTRRRTPSLSYS
jgi:SynChlorMet cassette radical SAM/SPASM protein ScmF